MLYLLLLTYLIDIILHINMRSFFVHGCCFIKHSLFLRVCWVFCIICMYGRHYKNVDFVYITLLLHWLFLYCFYFSAWQASCKSYREL